MGLRETFEVAVGPNAQFSRSIFFSGNGVSLSVSSSITSGVLNMRLTGASGIDPLSTLELTALTRDSVDVLGDVTEPAISPQLASDTAPGNLTGTNQQWSAGTGAFESGALYLVSYEIGPQSAFTSIYPGGTSPFPSQTANPLPTSPGIHHRLIEADDTQFGALLRSDGPGEVVSFSVKRAEWNYTIPGGSDGLELEFEITFGDQERQRSTYVPTAGVWYVRETGSDTSGTGALLAPFRTHNAAIAAASAGDTIRAGTGTYPQIAMTKSGTSGNPIVITNIPTETPVVEGDLRSHTVTFGGPGGNGTDAYRDGFIAVGQSYFEFRNHEVKDWWRNGVTVFGNTTASPATGIVIDGVTAHSVGGSAIRVEGVNSGTTLIDTSEDGSPRLTDVTVTNNTGYFANVPNDFLTADTETFSFANGIENLTTSNNVSGTDTLDTTLGDPTTGRSRGYGFDWKIGVRGITAHDNLAKNHAKYGFYFDSGRRWLSGVDFKNNQAHHCQNGIVLAREAGEVGKTYTQSRTDLGASEFVQELTDFDIYNFEFWEIDEAGIYLQAHPRDTTGTAFTDGQIDDIRIRFGTIYNAGRTGNDLNLFGWDNLGESPTNVDLIGIICWNEEGSVSLAQAWASQSGFTYEQNLIGTDPDFADVSADPPDFSLDAGSPAIALVTTAGRADAPFNVYADDAPRTIPASAGAYSGPAPTWVATPTIDGTEITFTASSGATSVVYAFSTTAPTYVPGTGWANADYQTGGNAISAGANTLTNDSGSTPAGDTTLWLYLVSADGRVSARQSVPVTVVASEPDIVIRESDLFFDETVGGATANPNTYSNVTLTGDAVADVEIFVSSVFGNSTKDYSITVGGVTPTLVSKVSTGDRTEIARYRLTDVAANSTGDIVITPNTGSMEMRSTFVVSIEGDYTSTQENGGLFSGTSPVSLDINTNAGGAVFAIAAGENGGGAWNWSGLTEQASGVQTAQPNHYSIAFEGSPTDETPRAISATRTVAGNHASAMVVSWSPA